MRPFFLVPFTLTLLSLVTCFNIAIAEDSLPPTNDDRSSIYDGCYNGCYPESSATKDPSLEAQCKKSCQCLANDFDQYMTLDEFAKAEFDSNNNPTNPKMKSLLDHCIKAAD